MSKAKYTLLIILGVALIFPGFAQEALAPAAATVPEGEPEKVDDVGWNEQIQQLSFLARTDTLDYILGPGDLIEISVYGVDTFNQEVRISSSGKVGLPFVGKVEVAGMTGGELEDRLTQLLTERRLIRDPQVSVFVKEYRSQPVYVMGAVNRPGQYMVTQRLNVIDVIAMAGGIDLLRAESYALLRHRASTLASQPVGEGNLKNVAAVEEEKPIRIDLDELLEKGNMALNFPIRGGDVLNVPIRNPIYYYVIGEVGRPGAYEMDPETEILVSQALAWAGGPQKTAKSNDGMLVRYENGNRRELKVDFKDILQGKKPDFVVQPEDVIFIPGSNFKTIGYGLIGALPNYAASRMVWGTYGRRGVPSVTSNVTQ